LIIGLHPAELKKWIYPPEANNARLLKERTIISVTLSKDTGETFILNTPF
jgi:hypothetical protein